MLDRMYEGLVDAAVLSGRTSQAIKAISNALPKQLIKKANPASLVVVRFPFCFSIMNTLFIFIWLFLCPAAFCSPAFSFSVFFWLTGNV